MSTRNPLKSKNFFMLTQGQAVSSLGSTIYSVVASLWIYELTGSTVLMGVVFSATRITRLLTFPFCGMIVDRFSRRNLLIICDVLCGMTMLAVSAGAAWGTSGVGWILVVYSIVSGATAGVFSSSLTSLMLTVATKEHYVQANSLYNAVEYGADMLGQSIAGSLYVLLGAPVTFLINGISFLFSARTEVFIEKDPKPERKERKSFWRDASEGIVYILHHRGICFNLLLAFFINFAFGVLRVALVPWMAGFGTEYLGLLGAFRSVGVVAATIALALWTIPKGKEYSLYFGCQVVFVICIACSVAMNRFLLIAAFFCIAYGNQYIFNTLQRSAVIIAAPNEVRGKVICAIQALAMGFSALGNLCGGFLCEYFAPRPLVFSMMAALLVCVLFFGRNQDVKNLFKTAKDVV